MYCYFIKEDTGSRIVEWRLLSDEVHLVGGSTLLYRIDGEVARDQNAEETYPGPPIEVCGTIVESKPVREGAILDGATVVTIGVEFERDGKRWTQKHDEPYLAR